MKNKAPKKVAIVVINSLFSSEFITGLLYGLCLSCILIRIVSTSKLKSALKVLGYKFRNTFTEIKKVFLKMFTNSQ